MWNRMFMYSLVIITFWCIQMTMSSYVVILVFTRGQFWPSGIVVACVCPCVRQSWAFLCDNSSQVRASITKFGPKNAKYFAQGPYCFGDWLGLTFQVKFYFIEKYVYLHRFCIFEIFVRHVCLTAPHPTWLRTHSLTTTCPPTGSRDRLWNCLYVYLGETIGVSASLDSAIGTQFYKLLSVFDILYTPHMRKFYMPTLGNRRTALFLAR